MEQNQNRIAPEAATDEPASPVNNGDTYLFDERVRVPPLLTDFDPVPLRFRHDGLTPQKQREYVEALADCGIAKEAAARIGVTEQAVAHVRRRADARAFDLACEAAQRLGARRIRSVAYERAIEGTVKRHYYHGELKSEEVVYDNRLLIYLLGKTAHLAEPPAEPQQVIGNWEPWMAAIEQGLPEPPSPPAPEPEPGPEPLPDPKEAFDGTEVWEQPDGWWTRFPPPAGFDGEEVGQPGHSDYRRRLSDKEQELADYWEACDLAEETERRDLFFGFRGGSRSVDHEDSDGSGHGDTYFFAEEARVPTTAEQGESDDEPADLEGEIFSPREAETNGTSVQLPPESGAAEDGETPDPPEPPRTGPRITAL